ncbi:MFS transporter [Candidatus Bathyarchaeota archaeon]|nr:MFS transporter [Candidatus Bathyarchaeota archaeon]
MVAQLKGRGKSFALYRTSNSLGSMLGPVIGGIIGRVNLSYPFYIGGLLSFLAIPSVFLLYERGYHLGEEKRNFFTSLRDIVLTKKIVLLILATFIVELNFASLELIIPLFGSSIGLSPASIGIILSSYFISFTFFQVPIGMISEKVNKKTLIILCSFAGALPFIILSYFHDVVVMSLALGTLGITLGTVFVQASVLMAEVAPEDKKSLYMAFFDSIVDLSFIIMPPIAAYAFTYRPTAPFILCASLMIIGGIIFMKE